MNNTCLSDQMIKDWHEGILDEEDANYVVTHLDNCMVCAEKERQLMDEEKQVLTTIASLGPKAQRIPNIQAAFQRLEEAIRQEDQVQERASVQTEIAWQRQTTKRIQVKIALQRFWTVCTKQIALVHRGIWLVTALIVLLIGCAFLILSQHTAGNIQQEMHWQWLFTIMVTTASGVGVAYINGADNDPGLEITLSTPTSPKLIVCCRALLMIGYNILLASVCTGFFTLVTEKNGWGIAQQWFGPLMLYSAVGLLLSQFMSSKWAIGITLMVEAVEFLSFSFSRGAPTVQFLPANLWHTNPTILLVAIVLIVLAVFSASYKERQIQII